MRRTGGVLRVLTLGCLAAGAFLAGGGLQALAQSAPPIPVSDGWAFLSPQSVAEVSPFEEPSSDYSPLHAGPWTLYPSLFSGVSYNDNLYQTTTSPTADLAWRTTPTFVAINNGGINKLSLYAVADSYVYLRHSDADTVDGRIGFQDVWEMQRDLVLHLSADVSRQTDTLDSGQIGGVTILPLHFLQSEANASVLKSFNLFFVGLKGSMVNSTYDNAYLTVGPPQSQSFRDLDASTVSARAGYYIGPTIYSYVEASDNQQNYYNDPLFSSNGYRVVGGIGSDQLSLFRGEIYGGYQEQFYRSALGGAQGGAAFGGRISWLPTEFLTFSLSLDQSLGTSAATSLTATNPSATETTSANFSANYALAQTWSASAHVGYSDIRYIGSPRIDDDWSGGVTLNRQIWENLDATLDYQLNRVTSNFADASYTQNVYSLGLTYKY